MTSYNSQVLGSKNPKEYRIQLTTNDKQCYETVEEIIRLYIDRANGKRILNEKSKQTVFFSTKWPLSLVSQNSPFVGGFGVS